MPPNPPQTLSVKRKRHEASVGLLIVEHGEKRQKSETYAWRLVKKPGIEVPPSLPSPAQPDRRFHVSYTAGSRVLVELPNSDQEKVKNGTNSVQAEPRAKVNDTAPFAVSEETPRPRKRPGAGTALHSAKLTATETAVKSAGPSEDEIRQFEKFSAEVDQDERAKSKPPTSPLKFKPKVPALRYKDRHPEKAAALAGHDSDAMDVDDYVYDTYVREVVMPDANGKIPETLGTVGIIVLHEEDEDWWNGDDQSDREFATDDEDENAEDYYANDYPEDELSSDDEHDRNLYKQKYRHGSDDEEFDLNDSDQDAAAHSDGDEDDEHFRRVARPKQGYWGRVGE